MNTTAVILLVACFTVAQCAAELHTPGTCNPSEDFNMYLEIGVLFLQSILMETTMSLRKIAGLLAYRHASVRLSKIER